MGHEAEQQRSMPDIRSELEKFNAYRRMLLNGKPIDPEGEEALMEEARDA